MKIQQKLVTLSLFLIIGYTYADNPAGMIASFTPDGNAYMIITGDNYLAQFSSDNKMNAPLHIFDDKVNAVSYTGNAVYVATDAPALQKCDTQNPANCSTIDTFAKEPAGVSFDSNGTGYVVSINGNLDKYQNNKFIGTVYVFDDRPTAVSYTGNAVYVTTDGNELKKCDTQNSANCSTIDKFNEKPIGVSFDNNSNGFVITTEGNLDKYQNDKFQNISMVFTHVNVPNSVSYTGNAVYLTIDSGRILEKCTTQNSASCQIIYNLNNPFKTSTNNSTVIAQTGVFPWKSW